VPRRIAAGKFTVRKTAIRRGRRVQAGLGGRSRSFAQLFQVWNNSPNGCGQFYHHWNSPFSGALNHAETRWYYGTHGRTSVNRAIAFAISTVALTAAGSAAADSPNLKGAYGFTGTASCVVAQGHVGDPNGPPLPNPTPGVALANSGFNANLQVLDVPGAFSRSFSVEGIRTFNGDGTGTVSGTAVNVTVKPTPGPGGFPHFPPSASGADFSFSFTYTVNADGTWTSTMVPGSYSETFNFGPRTGQTATVDAIPPQSGMISRDGKTLIVAHLAPVVETHRYSNGDVTPEICDRSRVLIKLQDADDDNDHGHDH
jgi:hypothetical protein